MDLGKSSDCLGCLSIYFGSSSIYLGLLSIYLGSFFPQRVASGYELLAHGDVGYDLLALGKVHPLQVRGDIERRLPQLLETSRDKVLENWVTRRSFDPGGAHDV